jgi:outer membrane autotransporter protein
MQVGRVLFVLALTVALAAGLAPAAHAQSTGGGGSGGIGGGSTSGGSSSSGGSPSPIAASLIDQGLSASGAGLIRSGATVGEAVIGAHARAKSQMLAGGGGTLGLSAGAPPATFGVWVDASGSYISNDAAGKAYEGGGPTFLSGIDATIDNAWVVGFSAGYNRADLNVNVFDGNRVTEGAILGPYVSYVVNDHVTVDASFTYTRLATDFTTGPTNPVRGSFNSNRFAGAANVNYFDVLGPVSIVGSIGYAYAYEHADRFLDSVARAFGTSVDRYGAVKLGLELSYPMGAFEPYLPLGYEYDTTTPQDGAGRSAVLLGVGLRYTLSDTLKAGLVATTEELRSHQRDATIAANLRYSF